MPPKYVKKDPISHILDRPDMYVGSTRPREVQDYVVVNKNYEIECKTLKISPALLRIFIEPLSNVIDNVARSKKAGKKVTSIKITIDEKTGETTFWNDGEVIPIELHPEEKCYNHTLVFGHLLTSSNYDDTQDRHDISGRNGLGIKAVCVFSKRFHVEGADPVNKKTFSQTWYDNMRKVDDPVVKDTKLKTGYTYISYIPDFSQFHITGYSPSIVALFKRYVVDMAMLTKVSVYFNDEPVPVKSLTDYAGLFKNNLEEEPEQLYIKTDNCEVVLRTANEHSVVSFANGVYTPLGGTHVDAWLEQVFRPILQKLNKPKKPQLTIADVKRYFQLFVIASVRNPEYDSQSKLRLEAPVVEAVLKKAQLNSILKWNVMDKLEEMIRAKELISLKKTERKKRGHEKVDNLDPANNEGDIKCTLIVVEGLSAKTYAVQGIQKGVFGRKGRDWNGIISLRGKILNTRNSNLDTVSKNKVVSDIIKALGVRYGVDYTQDDNYNTLRYGRLLSITDGDTDGIHICSLLQNLFHSLFPSLLQRSPPFFTSMQTPIVRVYMNRGDRLFYDEREYRKYVQENPNKKINKKYYKGLGASNQEDIKESFGQKILEFVTDTHTTDTMNKVFHSKHSDQRKDWLESYDPNNVAIKWNGNVQETHQITFSDYLNTELIKFSIDDCKRSIPNLMDGLKEGHRKVLFVCFLRNLRYTGKTLKVAQLAGSVAENSGYHHGEQNLYDTITNMANDYVGSNNIPLLFRDGQFGSRLFGGEDAANGRYIYTKLDCLTRLLYREEDDGLLTHVEDDGEKVEPTFYIPILPTILINGSNGIGTGWSCNVPCYNPLDLIGAVKEWLDQGETKMELTPWYRGFTGKIEKLEEHKYCSYGTVERNSPKQVTVTELPVGMWTNDFKDNLEALWEEKLISSYKNQSTPQVVNFVIKESSEMKCDVDNLKLYRYIRTSNIVLFTEEGKVKKFNSINEIINSYCEVRFGFYVKRKKRQLEKLDRQIKYLGNKQRFLEEVRDGDILLFETVRDKKQSRSIEDLTKDLEKRGYDKMVEEGEEGHYSYLLSLQFRNITYDKITQLKNDIASLKVDRDTLAKTSEKQLWLNDLSEFEKAYSKW